MGGGESSGGGGGVTVEEETETAEEPKETSEERKVRKAAERARQEAVVIGLGGLGVFGECLRGGTQRVVLKVEDAEKLIALVTAAS